jgi:hypothetical protein
MSNDIPAHKRIGELNGPWAFLLKFTLGLFPIFVPLIAAGAWWVVSRINILEKNQAVVEQIVQQIKINTETLNRHEKMLGSTDSALAALIRELGPLDQRIRLFVTRAEWELRNETRDREMNTLAHSNTTQHSDILAKLDRLIERRP